MTQKKKKNNSGLHFSLHHPASLSKTNMKLLQLDTAGQDLQEEIIPAACSGSCKKKHHTLAVGDSLLKSTKVPFCRSDKDSPKVCCLPGGKIQDTAETVLQLGKSTDCYSLLYSCPFVWHECHWELEHGQNQRILESPGNTSEKSGCPSYLLFNFAR